MTLAIAVRRIAQTLLARMAAGKGCLMEITNLGKADGLPPVDWAAVAAKLDAGSAPAPDAANSRTTWLSTINEDGSPHVTAVGALWLDGTFWFQTGAGTRKGRNVARDPRCSVAVSVRDADVVIEGDAARVTEPGALARIAKAWADQGWPAEPDDSGPGITAPFNAPSQGPPPWNVYRIEPRSAMAVLLARRALQRGIQLVAAGAWGLRRRCARATISAEPETALPAGAVLAGEGPGSPGAGAPRRTKRTGNPPVSRTCAWMDVPDEVVTVSLLTSRLSCCCG
jgi:hypothetical protein